MIMMLMMLLLLLMMMMMMMMMMSLTSKSSKEMMYSAQWSMLRMRHSSMKSTLLSTSYLDLMLILSSRVNCFWYLLTL